MPEYSEVKIMSEFINHSVNGKKFIKLYHVEKGNNPIDSQLINDFQIESISHGKQLSLKLYNNQTSINISVFMGMSGNWKWIKTENWNETKFIRMRLDTTDGWSLLLYGLYMGPKYKIGGFTGVKRGPDPTKQFEEFKSKVLDNIQKRSFDKPICEVLLNQEYFNGIGNYLRSTIMYYLDVNPFESARNIIKKYPQVLDMCRDIPIRAYGLNGGQLSDWTNPFDTDYHEFQKWVFYQKGLSCKDNLGRTFWFHEKWRDKCPYQTIK